MGGCLSRKNGSSFNSSLNIAASPVSVATKEPIQGPEKGETEVKIKKKVVEEEKVKKEAAVVEEEGLVKKEIFVIKHRKSHDRERPLIPSQNDVSVVEEKRVSSITPASSTNTNPSACSVELGNNVSSSMVVRTSSCTKEEVDAILIQCGRLSRSNSSGKVASSGRKYSGSKRSYDLDQEQDMEVANATANYDYKKRGNDSYCNDDEDDEIGGAVAERRQHRQRHRHSGRPSPSSSSQGRRRTPSREREQRSGSRERGNGSSSSGRRVSRSPNRRSETNPATANSNSNGTNNVNNNSSTSNKPGKMVSVPATVSSLTMDKSNNNGIEPQTASTSIKRISVKRNVGEAAVAGSRSVASPRSQSPARANGRGSNENNSNQQQQQPPLSRSSSRKAEHSPHRRNPLSEIDTNSLVCAQATCNNKNACINNNNNSSSRVQIRNKEIEGQVVVKESISVLNQVQKPNAETNRVVAQGTNCKVSSNFVKEPPVIVEDAKLQSSVIGADLKPQTLTRSRSARRSRDLDFNPETLLNPAAPSYTALLLEDIQNFHQKNTTTTTTTPPSFSVPACVTKACSILEAVADLNSTTSSNLSCPTTTGDGANLIGKKLSEAKDPFVESEILVSDDLTEPSFHKYVTVRRGGTSCAAEDMDGQESSGSNSFVGSGSQQHWGYSTSSWEPNSADSTDRWTSRSNTREEDDMEEARRGFSGQRSGIGRGRVGSSKNLHSTPIVAATAST